MKKMNVTKLTSGLTLLAAGALSLCLTACGGTIASDDADNADVTTETVETTTDNSTVETNTDNDTVETTEPVSAAITIEVTDAEGNTTSYTGTTDDEFLFGAIEDIDGVTIDGYESDWGYYITTVNDMTADYDADGAYWSIYVNGEYGSYGVDTQPVTDGDVYTFKYEVYQADDAAAGDATDDAAVANITIEVTDADGNTTSYTGTTDDEFLFGAISDIDGVTIDGYESDWGYYVTTVNDMTADYDADGAYWSIYVNGEYGSYGVDTQPVTDGDVYTFKYEVYQAN